MNEIEVYTIDILRKLDQLFQIKSDFHSVKAIISRYYSGIIPLKYADKITNILQNRNLVHSIMEENGIMINEDGITLLAETVTDEYLLDRIFEFLRKASSPELINMINDKLSLELSAEEQNVFEAKIETSGLVESKKFGYRNSLKINAEGRIALSDFDTYSEYRKEQVKRKNAEAAAKSFVNTGNIIGSNVGQDSFFREASPTLIPSQKIAKEDKPTNQTAGLLMKSWKLISENKLISGVLTALIIMLIYYIFFGIKPH